jgi:hypothetical protein
MGLAPSVALGSARLAIGTVSCPGSPDLITAEPLRDTTLPAERAALDWALKRAEERGLLDELMQE